MACKFITTPLVVRYSSAFKYPNGYISSRPIANSVSSSHGCIYQSKLDNPIASLPVDEQVRSILAKIDSEASRIYAKILIYNFPFTITKYDRIMTHRINNVKLGDRIRLNRIREIGTPSYTLKGAPILNPSYFTIMATVMEHGRGRKHCNLPHKQRKGRRPKKNLKPPITILRITDISVNPSILKSSLTD